MGSEEPLDSKARPQRGLLLRGLQYGVRVLSAVVMPLVWGIRALIKFNRALEKTCPYCNELALRKTDETDYSGNRLFRCESCGADVMLHR